MCRATLVAFAAAAFAYYAQDKPPLSRNRLSVWVRLLGYFATCVGLAALSFSLIKGGLETAIGTRAAYAGGFAPIYQCIIQAEIIAGEEPIPYSIGNEKAFECANLQHE